IQLIAVSGSIGTALFVSIGSSLAKGGPGSLFLAYIIYLLILALINNSIAKISTFMPVSDGLFVLLATRLIIYLALLLARTSSFNRLSIHTPYSIQARMEYGIWNVPHMEAYSIRMEYKK
ncbi:hypothetical protein EDB81DRAFT_669997, partial [Dactylonectria macrodidyma]